MSKGGARRVAEPGTPKSTPKNLQLGTPGVTAQHARTRLFRTGLKEIARIGGERFAPPGSPVSVPSRGRWQPTDRIRPADSPVLRYRVSPRKQRVARTPEDPRSRWWCFAARNSRAASRLATHHYLPALPTTALLKWTSTPSTTPLRFSFIT